MLNTMFEFVFASSAAATVLFLAASAIRPLTNKFFSAGWHCYMWLAVLIIMVLPLKINIPIPSTDISYEFAESTEADAYNVITPDVLNISEQNINEALSPLKNMTVNYAEYIALIWFIVACSLFCAKLAGYSFLLRKIHINSKIINCPEIAHFTSRKIVVRCSKSLSSPLLLGIIKPQLILPDVNLSTEQLNNILLHEMTHFKRKDVLLKWFACLVKCIHWFNPIVYTINRQINTDCEIACDIEVIKNMNEHEKKDYINTIIFLIAQSKSKSLSLTTAMASSKAILKKRFAIIKSYKKSKKALPLSIGVALILITLSVFTGGLISNKITPYANNIITPVKTDERNGNSFNFLIIGEDESRKADTIIVFSFKEDKASVLSIPRSVQFNTDNRFVRITDVINEKDGNQKAIEAIQRTLAIPINYYARINISTVKEILNELGNIEFNVPKDMAYEDPYQNLHINLKKGMQTLDAERALQLLRFRGYPEGDIDRIKIQQQFLKEVINQKRNQLASNSYTVTKLISENVITNYSMKNFINDSNLIANTKNIEFYTLPVINSTADRYFYHNVDFTKAENVLENFRFVGKKKKETLTWPCPSSRTITNTFGTRVHPITGETKTHNGIDIKANNGDIIVSAISGKVTKCGFDDELGNFITIQSKKGIETTYTALSEINIKEHETISEGQHIGKAGNTGTSTGAHFHFEIKVDGEFVNPKAYFE